MAEPEALTLTYISAHPAEAARVLERIPGADAAELFATVPARAGAPVLTAMLRSAAARIFGSLDDAPALALLGASGVQAAMTMLRYVPEPRRSRLLGGLPTATAVASRVLLGYPDDSVGAWADPDVIALAPETRVSDALERVRDGDERKVEQVYAVDNEQRLVGIVDLLELLRVPDSSTLAAVLHKPLAMLTAMTPLTGAATQRGWQQSSVLPVVERDGRLIGVMHRATLARALARSLATAQPAAEVTITGVLTRGYWDAASGLAEAGLWLLPPAKPVQSEDS
jgi:magnesium transporter